MSASKTPELRILFGYRGHVLIYEKHDAVILRYMDYVKDYTEIHTVPADMNIKVIHSWRNPGEYIYYSESEYEGPMRDWNPIYVMAELPPESPSESPSESPTE